MIMKPKNPKRIIFTESECHTLVDIVINYKDVVECKKTDAVTWKQKAATWEKIAELYNSATTEPRTAEQLRCKFDNLKKDVRKYEAQKRQNVLRTGGGMDDVYIKEVLKLLYAKIKSIISLSVKGLEASIGDSDDIFPTGEDLNSVKPNINNMEVLFEADIPSSSKVIELEEDFGSSTGEEAKKLEVEISDTPAPKECSKFKGVEEKHDWSDYTPKKLQSRKHQALQTKRKRSDSISFKEEQATLKKRLLEEEAARNQEYHEQRLKREQEIHILKSQHLVLQNEKLELEILLLKKQLYDK